MVNFKIYDVTKWTTNNYNTHFAKDNQTMKFGPLVDYNMINTFLKNHTQNVVRKLVSDPFIKKTILSMSLYQQSEML